MLSNVTANAALLAALLTLLVGLLFSNDNEPIYVGLLKMGFAVGALALHFAGIANEWISPTDVLKFSVGVSALWFVSSSIKGQPDFNSLFEGVLPVIAAHAYISEAPMVQVLGQLVALSVFLAAWQRYDASNRKDNVSLFGNIVIAMVIWLATEKYQLQVNSLAYIGTISAIAALAVEAFQKRKLSFRLLAPTALPLGLLVAWVATFVL